MKNRYILLILAVLFSFALVNAQCCKGEEKQPSPVIKCTCGPNCTCEQGKCSCPENKDGTCKCESCPCTKKNEQSKCKCPEGKCQCAKKCDQQKCATCVAGCDCANGKCTCPGNENGKCKCADCKCAKK